jgi:dynactin complex subunit
MSVSEKLRERLKSYTTPSGVISVSVDALIRTVDELLEESTGADRIGLTALLDNVALGWRTVGWVNTIRELAHKAKAATASSSRFLELEKNNDELRKRLHERQRELDKVRVQLSNMRRMLDEEAKPQGDVMKIKPEHYAHLKAEIQSNLTGRMLTKRRAGSLTIVIDPFT